MARKRELMTVEMKGERRERCWAMKRGESRDGLKAGHWERW